MASFLSQIVSPLWGRRNKSRNFAPTPRNKSWTTADGVITGLTHFELCLLNAQEERVLPAEMRIKIVVAQEQKFIKSSKIEVEVRRLNGIVRTLALYGLLEGNGDGVSRSKFATITAARIQELGKMLVAAVQLELFHMLDEICVAADVENELFDDLCCDAIQTGALEGFVFLTLEVLLSPGSGYKRLIQIRKDQMVESIASKAGLSELAGYDCHTPLSPDELDVSGKSANGDPGDKRRLFGSESSLHSMASGGLAVVSHGNNSRRASFNGGDVGEGTVVERTLGAKTNTARMRDLLSSIDGLATDVAASEASISALTALPPLSPHISSHQLHQLMSPPPMISSSGFLRSGSMGSGEVGAGPSSGGRSAPGLSIASTLSAESEGSKAEVEQAAFFPTEGDDGITYVASPSPEQAAAGGGPGDPLLSEVDWLMAETMAALGPAESGNGGAQGPGVMLEDVNINSDEDGAGSASKDTEGGFATAENGQGEVTEGGLEKDVSEEEADGGSVDKAVTAPATEPMMSEGVFVSGEIDRRSEEVEPEANGGSEGLIAGEEEVVEARHKDIVSIVTIDAETCPEESNNQASADILEVSKVLVETEGISEESKAEKLEAAPAWDIPGNVVVADHIIVQNQEDNDSTVVEGAPVTGQGAVVEVRKESNQELEVETPMKEVETRTEEDEDVVITGDNKKVDNGLPEVGEVSDEGSDINEQ